MPWVPTVPGEVPTLGYVVLDWMTEMLAAPDRGEYEPFVPYREQEDFILRWYALDPRSGRRVYHRGLLGRPRGWGKSPLLAALACVEALAPVVPDGWDADGQPVGKPWSEVRTPLVQIAAVSEEQTQNTWSPVLEMLRAEAPVHDHYDVDPMETFVALPNRGRMHQITASARTVKGARAHFAVLDQTEEWVRGNGGLRLATTMRSNAAKVGGTTLESPNAFIPGEGSVAEGSAAFADQIRAGLVKDKGLLYDHREAPADTDLTDRESLTLGLRVAYGCSSGHPGGCVLPGHDAHRGHVDLDRLIATIWDSETDAQVARSDFLNQITHASDSWISSPDLRACMDSDKIIADKDRIVLGFDGSRGRVRGKADATALIGCRVSDGHLFEIGVWQAPHGDEGKDWVPNVLEVDAAIRSAFERWTVVGFYADPSGWTTQVAEWEARYGRRLKVKAARSEPIAAWPRGKDTRVTEWVERFRQAVVERELTYDGSLYLTSHILNARRRATRSGYLIYKKFPESPDKIDAAYAALMAWKARCDAVAAGQNKPRSSSGRVVVM